MMLHSIRFVAVVAGALVSSNFSVSSAPSDNVLAFDAAQFDEAASKDGPRILWTHAYRKDRGGFYRFVLGCHKGQISSAALQLNPKSQYNFAYNRKFDPSGNGIGLEYKIKFDSNDDYFLKINSMQKYIIVLSIFYNNFKQLSLINLISPPTSSRFMERRWETMTVSADTTDGEAVSITIKRDDPQLQSFFDQCKASA